MEEGLVRNLRFLPVLCPLLSPSGLHSQIRLEIFKMDFEIWVFYFTLLALLQNHLFE